VRVEIESSIEVQRADIPREMAELVKQELTIRDPDDGRKSVQLWTLNGPAIIIPRGYAGRFEQIAAMYGEQVEWINRMTLSPPSQRLYRDWTPTSLRDYQEPARDALLDAGQGLYSAQTGAGKSITSLETIRWSGQRAIVLVGKVSLATQWAKEARDFYGYGAGYIGEGRWDERELTICVWQTLLSRKDSLPETWWSKFGFVLVDECQHGSSFSHQQLVQMFPAFYRVGVSATPDWREDLFPIVKAIFGPVVFETARKDVGDKILTPSIKVVETGFEFDFHGDYTHLGVFVRNNYSDLQSAISTDDRRNDLIAKIARDEARDRHHVLVITRRIAHVKQLVARLEKTMQLGKTLHVLTGSQTGADAERVAASIGTSDRGTVLISTIADEGIDIPRLDRLVMAFPVRHTPLIEQQIGRILRPADGKEDAKVFDLRDGNVGVLMSQQLIRSKKLYMRRKWPVEREEGAEV